MNKNTKYATALGLIGLTHMHGVQPIQIGACATLETCMSTTHSQDPALPPHIDSAGPRLVDDPPFLGDGGQKILDISVQIANEDYRQKVRSAHAAAMLIIRHQQDAVVALANQPDAQTPLGGFQ